MKKIILFALLVVSVQFSFAAFPSPPAKADSTATIEAAPKMNNLTAEQKRAFMQQLSNMSVKEFEIVTGRKLSTVEKLSLKLTQNRLKHQLKRYNGDDSEGFNIGGFILGLLLGLLGVLLAYIFSKDRNFRKWSWIGLGVLVVIVLIAAI